MNFSELHWAAGFLEGEASFHCGHSIQLSASQVQMWPLEQLQRIFGGTIRGRSNRKINDWQLNGYQAAAVMMTLWSLMSPRRKEQIVSALAQWKTLKIEA